MRAVDSVVPPRILYSSLTQVSLVEATTTSNIPVWFPQRKKQKRRKKMKEAILALELVEDGLTHSDALDFIIEGDIDKAAEKMAAGIKDPEKKAEAVKKFKAQIEKRAGKK